MGTKLAEWSRAVRVRDGKCVRCGAVDGLHAHHKLPKLTHPELMLDVENGEALCLRCHRAEHERGRAVVLGKRRAQRRTLEKKIAQLEAKVVGLELENGRLRVEVRSLKSRISGWPEAAWWR